MSMKNTEVQPAPSPETINEMKTLEFSIAYGGSTHNLKAILRIKQKPENGTNSSIITLYDITGLTFYFMQKTTNHREMGKVPTPSHGEEHARWMVVRKLIVEGLRFKLDQMSAKTDYQIDPQVHYTSRRGRERGDTDLYLHLLLVEAWGHPLSQPSSNS